MNKQKNIIVLGATGMLGRIVYAYFKHFYTHTYGTSRTKDKEFFLLDVEKAKYDFKRILNNVRKIDLLINCIGAVSEKTPPQTLIKVNSLFPHTLSELSKEYGFRLIHISTDAVYPSSSKRLTEASPIGPQSLYAASKLLGEVISQNAINIRTSLIGFDPKEHKGVLEYANMNSEINGFYNHIWTGCTTLQFAQFCEYLLSKQNFLRIRRKTPYINFSPLGPISKYHILQTYMNITKIVKIIHRKKTPRVNRTLTTNYFDLLNTSDYTTDIKKAIYKLLEFEKEYGKR